MKIFWTILISVILTAGLVGGGGYYLVNKKITSDQKSFDAKTADLAAQVDQEKISPNEFYPSGASSVDSTNWKVYNDTEFHYSFKYPSDWTILDNSYTDSDSNNSKVLQLDVLPTRYYQIWKDMRKTKDGTIPNENINCYHNGTIESLIPSGGIKGLQDVNLGTYDSGIKAKYYLATPLWDIEHYLIANGKDVCELSRPTTDDSPLTKDEDATGYEILQSFNFVK